MMPDAAKGSASASPHAPPAPPPLLRAAAAAGAPAPHPVAGAPTVVMGVAGCGKSSLAEALGQHFSWPMIEGDAFHSPESRARMQAGVALTDDDRAAWLAALGHELARHPEGAVLACSALKRSYRDILRGAAPGLRFVFLDITQDDALQRVTARAGDHFFHPGLVLSQFEALEPPQGEPDVLRLDAARSLSVLCASAADWLTRDIPSQPAT
jgi:gluconokinase